jgi:hypothetical protein
MRLFLLSFFVICSCAVADDRQEMRSILEANFAACNSEDLDALMDTCSVDMPDRDGFRRESKILFKEKDIHYSMEDFRVTMVDGDYAEAWVVQATYSKDRTSDTDDRRKFRNRTTLLPKDECVEYSVAFKRDGQTWKCYMTISEPIPYRRAKVRK